MQLCGRLVVRLGGARVERGFPGRQGRLAFTFLALNRHGIVTRAALIDAIWPERAPALVDTALNALLSKLRRATEPTAIDGRDGVRLVLPDAWVDVEAAGEAIHRAEAAVARGDWVNVWGPGRVALHIVRRGFLPGVGGLVFHAGTAATADGWTTNGGRILTVVGRGADLAAARSAADRAADAIAFPGLQRRHDIGGAVAGVLAR